MAISIDFFYYYYYYLYYIRTPSGFKSMAEAAQLLLKDLRMRQNMFDSDGDTGLGATIVQLCK